MYETVSGALRARACACCFAGRASVDVAKDERIDVDKVAVHEDGRDFCSEGYGKLLFFRAGIFAFSCIMIVLLHSSSSNSVHQQAPAGFCACNGVIPTKVVLTNQTATFCVPALARYYPILFVSNKRTIIFSMLVQYEIIQRHVHERALCQGSKLYPAVNNPPWSELSRVQRNCGQHGVI